MFRANIYSVEPLEAATREAVIDGVEMIAAYMGETVATRELAVRLPQTPDGKVKAERIGFNKLDKMVELHVMAVPLDRGEGERLGLAYMGRGTTFVDVSECGTQLFVQPVPMKRLTLSAS